MQTQLNRRLRIGFACDSFLTNWGGVERLFAELAAAMLARGHRVFLLAKPPAGTVSAKIPVTAVPEGCEILHAELDSAEGRAKARDTLRCADPDVLVAPCTRRDFLRYPSLLAGAGIPLVSAESIHPAVLTHERWNPYEHYAALAACDRVQVLLEPYKAYYPKALRGRIDVIGNPAPPPREIDWQARAARAKRTLLYVGRFDERDKQVSLLLRAWALLREEFPDWSLTLVGDGQGWDLCHAMAGAMGPDARIAFPGSVDDPGPYYAGADLLYMPSRQEGFPLVLGEAAAHGLPLVGFRDCEAARELIGPDCGALAEASNPAALAGALRGLMAAPPDARRRAGEAARDFFQTRYAAGAVYDQWEQLLTRAAEKRGFTRLDKLERDRWNAVLLNEAALEAVSRPDPLGPPEADGANPAAVLARLRSEHTALEEEHRRLQKKYDALLRQLQPGGGKRRR